MWDWISALDRLRRESRPAVLVLVCGTAGSTPRESGARMLVLADGSIQGTIGGGQVEHQAIQDALACLKQGHGGAFKYPLTTTTGQCCGGVMELYMDVLNTQPQLYIYGAGHVGQALCRTLEGTPFEVHLIDPRPEWVQDPRLPESVIRHPADWTEVNSSLPWHAERSYAAIMTPEHAQDLEIIADLLNRPHRYLGLVGSQSKWMQFQRKLMEAGVGTEALQSVHCPIGLPNLGKAPQEIAISIAAELLAHYHRV